MNEYPTKGTVMGNPAPRETIMNALYELQESTYDTRRMSSNIKDKIFGPEPCGENECTAKTDCMESLIASIRRIIRESNDNLSVIDNKI